MNAAGAAKPRNPAAAMQEISRGPEPVVARGPEPGRAFRAFARILHRLAPRARGAPPPVEIRDAV